MNDNINKDLVENPEPEWSLEMFMPDFAALFDKLLEILKSIINAIMGE